MRDPIEYFMSAEVTLSDKLLEVLYLVIGLLCIYTAFANLRTKRMIRTSERSSSG